MKLIWGKKISDLAYADLAQKLEYKTNVRKVGKYFASSKICSNCGHVKKDLKISDRLYICESCHIEIGRDDNASINIKREGISSLRQEGVRL